MSIIKHIKLPGSDIVHDISAKYDNEGNEITEHYATNLDLKEAENSLSSGSTILNGTTLGSGAEYTVSFEDYTEEDGVIFHIKLHVDSIAGATLKINDGTAKPLIYPSRKLLLGGLKAGSWLLASYSSELDSYIVHTTSYGLTNSEPDEPDEPDEPIETTELITITSSQTWTAPAGATKVSVFLVGGGYSGGTASGGAGGRCYTAKDIAVTPNQQIAITIGSSNGGNTTFGNYSSASGSSGGSGGYAGVITMNGPIMTTPAPGAGQSSMNGYCEFNNRYYAGGGGGGVYVTFELTNHFEGYIQNNNSAFGAAGGGYGATWSSNAGSGSQNTGGGGGGGTYTYEKPTNTGAQRKMYGYGGSGVCLILLTKMI